MQNFHIGFSLFELLIAMVLASLLLGMAVPSFRGLVAESRVRTETEALFHAVHRARRESVSRRRTVTLCALDNIGRCAAGSLLSGGWSLFANTTRTDELAMRPGEPLLLAHKPVRGVSITSNRQGFTFRGTDLRATNGTIWVCDENGHADARKLTISYTGRPRVERIDVSADSAECAA